MSITLRRFTPQPGIAVLTSLAAISAVGASTWAGVSSLSLGRLLVAGLLIAAFIGTRRFPVNVRSGMKLYMGSIPLFLMVALLPAAAAVPAVLVARFTAEWLTRKQRGLYPSDIATDVARGTVIAFLAASIAHAAILPIALPAAAIALLAGDILSSPLVLSPIMNERPVRVIHLVFKDAAVRECLQYSAAVALAVLALESAVLVTLTVAVIALGYGASRLGPDVFRALSSLRPRLSLRVFVAAGILAVNVIGSSVLTRPAWASLDIGPCRTDPIVQLSNGAVLRLTATVNTAPSNLQNVTYTIHAAPGVTITNITYTANATYEKVVLQNDETAASVYDVDTYATLASGSATATASTLIAGVGTGTAAGLTTDHLMVHIGS